jgi:bifunctional non-homologous end joining protein LigD
MGLRPYRTRRRFDRTPEPQGSAGRQKGNLYVIHKHAASHLHYDLRLQLEDTLKSWAVPKGPSLDPTQKRLAVHVEDHPLEYGKFEGAIPKGEYGAGKVILWDRGRWQPKGDPSRDYRKGRMKFTLEGEKLRGGFNLVRMGGKAGEDGKNWLLIKERDVEAKPGSGDALLQERPESVLSGRTLEEMSPNSRDAKSAGAEARRKADPPPDGGKKIAPPPAAPKQKLPRTVAMELATPVEEAPAGEEWLHEIKLDGYRAICRIRDGRAEFLTRRGNDWSGRLATLAAAAAALPVDEALLDGEIVKVTPEGRTSFQALQNSFAGEDAAGVSYFAFDLMHLNGHTLAPLPLAVRKEALRRLLEAGGSERIRYSDHVVGRGPEFFGEACRRGLEGIVSKRKDAPYRTGRGRDWLKIKCFHRQEFVIAGFTEPEGSREGLGALLLGVHDAQGSLVYCGRVGTGFTGAVLRDLQSRLARLERQEPPFALPPRGSRARGVHWVRPVLAAEVRFSEWTKDGLLRQPSFQGLREDKQTQEIVRERTLPVAAIPGAQKRLDPSASPAAKTTGASRKKRAASPAARTTGASGRGKVSRGAASRAGKAPGDARIAGVTLTHPEKILYPDEGISKRELAAYYEAIAAHVLPHLTGRPLTLVRCPEGTLRPCFYQKHVAGGTLPAAVRRVMIQEKKGRGAYLVIDSLEGLIGLVQRGVLEFHTWGSKAERLENPDRITFDLDPGPGVAWDAVLDAARLVRRRLSDRGLASFPKTTGGKGLHVVVPLRGRNDWQEVYGFSRVLAEAVVRQAPARFTATMSKAKRAGKIFIDYLRNVRGASAIAAYSTRARPEAPVSTPLRWEELTPALRSASFTLRNLPERLRSIRTDPWKDYERSRGTITAAMRRGL